MFDTSRTGRSSTLCPYALPYARGRPEDTCVLHEKHELDIYLEHAANMPSALPCLYTTGVAGKSSSTSHAVPEEVPSLSDVLRMDLASVASVLTGTVYGLRAREQAGASSCMPYVRIIAHRLTKRPPVYHIRSKKRSWAWPPHTKQVGSGSGWCTRIATAALQASRTLRIGSVLIASDITMRTSPLQFLCPALPRFGPMRMQPPISP
ncbi:hypothetical protein BD310DRAFT_279985 [Dichomitus squalens]|uniref:Uncharacterized protein n=1 Tax=Dichomitus squalens TaxID=114155 RepID=A0A4Q9QBG7_9APHY|nr:hypothetical protein BD310DRAFT_279985 [Dichomitus squalens]